MSVAVVGTGVAGLLAARQLTLAGRDVTVFESGSRIGGHSNTVVVDGPEGELGIDTGFIVFNERNYPNFERLLADVGVPTQPADMSFSVADGRGEFEWAAHPRGLFANPAHLYDRRFARMLVDLVRFFREARDLVGLNGNGPSLREFLSARGYSDYFVERLIVPQVSAVWSAGPDQLAAMPAGFVAEFLANHGALQLTGRPRWRSVTGGSRRYVEAVAAPFRDRVHTGTPVREIRRLEHGVELRWAGGARVFSDVVLACHSDQALALLADPSPAEREILGAIPYQRNEAILHTDERLMPRRRAAWAAWNYHLTPEPAGRTTVTYNMNRLQSLPGPTQYLVTLNRREAIDPARIVAAFDYEHPVYTREGLAAQRRWGEISGPLRTHYCGAYWRWGFHEDGAWSALRACRRLGALERGRRIPVAEESYFAGDLDPARLEIAA